ncbi:MAG: prepilin peptidase [Proteobacteria bacterium]|nr:MAG: prepilin peptidase [Pseudomonadota bacterium]
MGIFIAIFFLLGIVFGSFLNVCITRIPEGLSIVSPGSRCPRCLTPIKPYDNVPLFGWIWLGGKCRSCRLPISPMYPLVEFATGALFVACFLRFGLTLETAKWIVFCCLIVVLAVTDLRVRLLPDVINWPGFAIGLVFSTLVPPGDGTAFIVSVRLLHRMLPEPALGFLDALLGAAFGSVLLWGAATVYRLVRGREGMGMGDVKMMAFVGSFLAVRGAFLTILLGTLLGSLIGLGVIVVVRLSGWTKGVAQRASRRGLGSVNQLRWSIASRYQLPLGTFLAVGALAVVFFFMSPSPFLGMPVR